LDCSSTVIADRSPATRRSLKLVSVLFVHTL